MPSFAVSSFEKRTCEWLNSFEHVLLFKAMHFLKLAIVRQGFTRPWGNIFTYTKAGRKCCEQRGPYFLVPHLPGEVRVVRFFQSSSPFPLPPPPRQQVTASGRAQWASARLQWALPDMPDRKSPIAVGMTPQPPAPDHSGHYWTSKHNHTTCPQTRKHHHNHNHKHNHKHTATNTRPHKHAATNTQPQPQPQSQTYRQTQSHNTQHNHNT